MKRVKVNITNKFDRFIKENNVIPYTLIGISLFVLSMLLTMQVKTVNTTNLIYEGKREAELIEDLANLNQKYNELKKNYDESQKVVEEYQLNSTDKSQLIASMKEQINNLSVIAGTTQLSGQGIIVVLEDGDIIKEESTRKDTLVHDSDILTVVNELMVAGAEAVSVNEERIITNSAIRCVGSVVQINYNKIGAPFVIKAIGNAQYLESAINIKNGVADLLRNLGIKVTVTRSDDITVPKFNGTISFKFAK